LRSRIVVGGAVLIERIGTIALITLNRPEVRNAIDRGHSRFIEHGQFSAVEPRQPHSRP
jgi:hypothetical protein